MEAFFDSHIIINIFLVVFLIAVLGYDLAIRKIPNFLTFPAIILGLVFYTVMGGLQGFLFSFYGLLLGTAFLLLPFILGGIGAGDVKLLGGIGALKGWEFVLWAALYSAVIGGVIAVVYLIYKGRFLSTLKKGGSILSELLRPFILTFKLKTRLGLPFKYNSSDIGEDQEEKGQEEKAVEAPLYFPYGVAIVIGTFVVLSGFSIYQ